MMPNFCPGASAGDAGGGRRGTTWEHPAEN
jgi:hypothetical protein